MNILHYIPEGRDNAISRRELARITGLPDRTVRAQIKQLVREGIPILSSSAARGYWISYDPDDIDEFIKECDSRSRSEYMTTLALRKRVADATGQRLVPVRAHMRRITTGECMGQVNFGRM